MSQQASPLTYEGILELFRKSDERFAQSMAESRREFDQRIGKLSSRVGEGAFSKKGRNFSCFPC